ncbi:MAG TPA: maleylpyruvate isomerase N-terminal domain-containing protein, partial [Acidimicrobiales bacterium]
GFTLEETFPPFRAAADWCLEVVGQVTPDQWDRPGLGEWSIRELAAHTSRAFLLVETYLANNGPIDVVSAADYFRMAMPDASVNRAIAERGRDEAVDLGDDPAAAIAARATRAVRAVELAPARAVCVTFAGTLSLADYLATRVVEVCVHTLDLADALGLAEAEPPAEAAMLSVWVLGALAAEPSPAVLLRALTGRVPLPQGFSVFP